MIPEVHPLNYVLLKLFSKSTAQMISDFHSKIECKVKRLHNWITTFWTFVAPAFSLYFSQELFISFVRARSLTHLSGDLAVCNIRNGLQN